MNCLECRRLTLINPQDDNPARTRHLQECERCARFSEQIMQQDELIREAALVDVPEGFAARILLNQSLQPTSRRPTRWNWLSLAASLFLAVTLYTGAVLVPGMINETFYRPFENDLVAHTSKHDMFAHVSHEHITDPEKIREVLAVSDTALPGEFGSILDATTCVIDGIEMAHLLMEKDNEQFVVYVIPQQSIVERTFRHSNWAGQLVNVDHRSLAVLNRDGVNLEAASSHFAKVLSTPLPSG